jgi:predicted nucleic acid-binding Zn ribbon protein
VRRWGAAVLTLAEAHQAHRDAVLHAERPLPLVPAASDPPSASCARCGASVAPRLGARFCSAGCRKAEVRDRRAVARADLLIALAGLRDAIGQVEAALQVMGFNPSHPRHPRSRR